MHHQNCLDTNTNVNPTLLQIRLTLIDAGLPSPAMLLFNRPIKGLLAQMNREPININNDDNQYEAHKTHQDSVLRTLILSKTTFPVGSTVAVQCEEGGPWMLRVIREANTSDHRGNSYIISVMKMGRLITWDLRHVNSTSVMQSNMPLEHNRKPSSCTADSGAHVDHGKIAVSNKEEKEIILPH